MPTVVRLFTLLLLLASGWRAPAAAQNADRPPNIVVVLADDLGYGDLGAYNPASHIPTPHLDRLAAQGMRFTDAHSPSAVCTPSRYGLLTGRYAWRTPLRGVLGGYSPNLIDTTRLTLPALLKEAGYTTAGIGKWHLGLGREERTDYAATLRPGPRSLGFDHYFGIPASLDMEPYLYFEDDRALALPTGHIEDSRPCCIEDFYRGGGIAPGFRHEDVQPTLVRKAVGYLERQAAAGAAQPFFLYLALAAPHTPWLPTAPFQGISGAGAYGDFTAQVDAGVGDVLAALDRLGLAENTVVVVTSDNGAYWRPEEIVRYGHRANLHWRGMKADAWEAGHRVPFIVRWPGRVAPGTVSDQLIVLTDLMATFAAAAGRELPATAGEDSYDLLPVWLGEAGGEPIREAAVFQSSAGLFAIRQGRWKLIEGLGSGGFSAPRTMTATAGAPVGQLYDLAADPGEAINLYAQRPDVVNHLQGLLERYQEQGHSRPPHARASQRSTP